MFYLSDFTSTFSNVTASNQVPVLRKTPTSHPNVIKHAPTPRAEKIHDIFVFHKDLLRIEPGPGCQAQILGAASGPVRAVSHQPLQDFPAEKQIALYLFGAGGGGTSERP